MKTKIAPSILSADFGNLNDEIKEVEPFSDWIHVDVMDGHFVPNITIGPAVVKGIKTNLPLDCHLMISDPVKYAKEFSKYCKRICFHAEIFEDDEIGLENAVKKIGRLGIEVGLTLNPDKGLNLILPFLKRIDYILIMSVYAGFGGQKFIPDVLGKIKDLRESYEFRRDIAIDGGINSATAKLAINAGANVLVAGSAIFGKKNRKKAILNLKS